MVSYAHWSKYPPNHFIPLLLRSWGQVGGNFFGFSRCFFSQNWTIIKNVQNILKTSGMVFRTLFNYDLKTAAQTLKFLEVFSLFHILLDTRSAKVAEIRFRSKSALFEMILRSTTPVCYVPMKIAISLHKMGLLHLFFPPLYITRNEIECSKIC